jgi:hypothetical protein
MLRGLRTMPLCQLRRVHGPGRKARCWRPVSMRCTQRVPFRFPLMHLLRECVVYWYSLSNPRTKFIHYDNCLVIRSCAFPAFLWCISFCLGQHAQGCTQASARARLTRARSAGGCAAPGDSGPVSRVTQGVPSNKTHTHTLSLSLLSEPKSQAMAKR